MFIPVRWLCFSGITTREKSLKELMGGDSCINSAATPTVGERLRRKLRRTTNLTLDRWFKKPSRDPSLTMDNIQRFYEV